MNQQNPPTKPKTMNTTQTPEIPSYRCTTCWKENLPSGQICKRLPINQWNEGTCLRCCDHNHG